jgi:hypothetical protein
MDYVVDLDPAHMVLRITVTTTAVTDESFRDIYQSLARLALGPYAPILDLSQVVDFRVSSKTIRAFAAISPAVRAAGKHRVVVAPQPVVYGLFRMLEMLRDSMGVEVQVVHSLDEAYELLEVTPEDFTERLLPERMAA